MPRWCRDPLVVFLLLGGGMFALDYGLSRGASPPSVIEVTEEQVLRISDRWTAQWGRPPTAEERQGLLDEVVEEEILYREARRLGFDRDDPIVRRRLAQKMTFMLEDTAEVATPTDGEVAEYLTTHADRYREPRRSTFEHVFLNDERRADPAGDAVALLRGIEGDGDAWRELGDPFMLRRDYADRTDQEIAELLGGQFAEAMTTLPTGDWHGPIRSAFGTHLVRVTSRTDARMPALDDVRGRVVADLIEARRREQNRAAVRAVRERYQVRQPAVSRAEPATR